MLGGRWLREYIPIQVSIHIVDCPLFSVVVRISADTELRASMRPNDGIPVHPDALSVLTLPNAGKNAQSRHSTLLCRYNLSLIVVEPSGSLN